MVAGDLEFNIEPHVGVGEVRFGMDSKEIHRILGEPTQRRGPGEFTRRTKEEFRAQRCFVEFDSDGRCSAIAFYSGASVRLDETNLMAMNYAELLGHLRARGAPVVEDMDGLRCDVLGISCYAPENAVTQIAQARVESILVYTRGYYDELDARLAAKAK